MNMSFVQLLFQQFLKTISNWHRIHKNFDSTFNPPANNTVHILTLKIDPDQLPHTIDSRRYPTHEAEMN